MHTNKNCPHCQLQFEHEPGFFWAAMYMSYAFNTGLMLVIGIIGVQLDWSVSKIVLIVLTLVLLILPFMFRYSRILSLYFFSPNRKFDTKYL